MVCALVSTDLCRITLATANRSPIGRLSLAGPYDVIRPPAKHPLRLREARFRTAPLGSTMQSSRPAVDLERFGGEEGIRRWVDRFYDKVAQHPLLVAIFPPDLTASRDKQYRYFVEFFGGPALYTEAHGPAFLRFKHRKAKIGEPERDAWLNLLLESLREETGDEDLVAAVEARVRPIANAMVNHHPEKKDAYFFN